MNTQPIRSEPGYTITREFCGQPAPRYVLRFCGEWISQHLHYSSAVLRAVGHNAIRKGAQPVTEKRPTF
jgi:hypothetical protein